MIGCSFPLEEAPAPFAFENIMLFRLFCRLGGPREKAEGVEGSGLYMFNAGMAI